MKRENKDGIRILSQEEKTLCLDFAKRMVFTGYEKLTQKRRDRLWSDVEWFISDALEEGHWGWETGSPDSTFPMCDWIHERFGELEYPSGKWEHKVCDLGVSTKYFSLLESTCRAAMDIVDGFAGGVWGWTIGDIKRMYDGQLPDWFPKDDWHILGNGEIAFSEMTDESAIAI